MSCSTTSRPPLATVAPAEITFLPFGQIAVADRDESDELGDVCQTTW